MGMKRASKRNLHIVKTRMPMNESYHILSFHHLANSLTCKLMFLRHLLDPKLRKNGKKIETVA